MAGSKAGAVGNGVSAGAGAADTASTIAGMGANAANAIAIQNYAAEIENQINNNMAVNQVKEQGPKNAKSLTQG